MSRDALDVMLDFAMWRSVVLLSFGFFAIALASATQQPDPITARATTSAGDVLGVTLPGSAGGSPVHQFLGMPFATAARFQAPVDFKGRYPGGKISASMWGPACMQVGNDPSAIYGSEDCLNANVWRPQSAAPGSNLPVMVFIYGGSNQFGEAEPYNMSALAAFHDVVCVSFNYRTGPIGWMAFQEDVDTQRSTGNWGILDIQSALRWVRREASNLGGDHERVAIFGQSSGGGLVELQYVAPGSAGLFRGAISESGGLSAMPMTAALRSSYDVAAALGCLTADGKSANKSCVAAVPSLNVTAFTYSGQWGPATDGVTFPKEPTELLRRGLVNDASVVFGAQTNDSNLFLFRSYTKNGLPQPNNEPDGALIPLPPTKYIKAVVQMVGPHLKSEALRLYPVDRHNHVQNVHQLGNMQSDRMHCSARQRATLFNQARPGKAFLYRFDYWYTSNSKCSAVPNFHLPYLGAAHQDEVTFVLGQPNFMEDGSCCGEWGLTTPDCPHLQECEACYAPERFAHDGYLGYFDRKEWEFAKLVGRFWTNVAASGDPNSRDPSVRGARGKQVWPRFSGGEAVNRNIVLNATLPGGFSVEDTPHGRPELCAFWDKAADMPAAESEHLVVV